MNGLRKKYIFFDIDGTLLSHRGISHIPDETRTALRRLKECGHICAAATARGAILTRPLASELGIDLMVCSNGAHVLFKDKVLNETWLDNKAIEMFKKTAALYPQNTSASDDSWVYSDNKSEETRAYINLQAGFDCIRPMSELRRAFIMYFFRSESYNEPEESNIFSTPPNFIELESGRNFIEARPAGTSKWTGIMTAARHLNFEHKDIITFGDNLNDVEMLRNAPIGVAVGGAVNEAKNAADYITDDIDDGGILKACIELKLF